ncbi:MAG: hypothetical protein ACLFVI_07760 [Archaeoglobaceae archaeon]
MDEEKELVLSLKEAYPCDLGKGLARIDMHMMKKLNLKNKDIVEIIGTSSVPALAWKSYPEDIGQKIIRIDGNLRRNAGLNIGEEVTIRKIKAEQAEEVTFSIKGATRLSSGNNYLLRLLEGSPLRTGQELHIAIFGQELLFTVTGTRPSGIVKVHKNTRLEIVREDDQSAGD